MPRIRSEQPTWPLLAITIGMASSDFYTISRNHRLPSSLSVHNGIEAMHALVIEDEYLIALEVCVALERLGFETVETAATERDAVSCAANHQPDLVTADYNLAEGTGVDAVKRICADRDTAVIFVSSAPAMVRREMPDAIVIGKPYTAGELISAVGSAM